MSEDKRVRYSRLNGRCPKNTLVTFRKEDLVYFGISRCHPEHDRFSKDLGKTIAEGRAKLAYIESSVYRNDIKSMETHKSGLRGVINVSNIKNLLTYFQNIDDIMFEQKDKRSVIESV